MAVSKIRIEETLQSENATKGKVTIVKSVNYTDITHKELIRLWDTHRSNIIGGFNDDKWIIPSNYKDKHRKIYFLNDEKLDRIFKSFFLVRISQGIVPYSEASRLCELIQFFSDTNNLSDDMYEFLENTPYEYICNVNLQSELLMFLDYAKIEKNQYRLLIKSLSYSSNSRIIPSFTSVLKFDNIIRQYIQDTTDKGLYDVVVLWWELTKVLPIRPIEFFTLKKDCLIQEKDNYYIKVKRAKLSYKQTDTPQVPLLDKLKISKFLYSLFESFIDKHNDILVNNDFIFNVDWYKHYFKTARVKRTNYIGSSELYLVFDDFYSNVVGGTYKYKIVKKQNFIELADDEIERIQYGDTRHLAFINMILQGISPYTIAQIGGHTTINQQISYYTHLEPYISSKAYCLSRNIIDGFADIGYGFGYISKAKSSIIKLSIDKDKIGEFKEIKGGYCTSNNIPFDCHYDECVFCPYSIITNESDYIAQSKEKLKNQLNTDIQYLKGIISPNSCSDKEAEKATLLNSINSTTNKLAVLYSKENDAKEI